MSSYYSSDSMDEGSDVESKTPKGRRNIREIKRSEDLNELTRKANREEEERKLRIEKREKQYFEQFAKAFPEADEKELILDYDLEKGEALVKVHPALTERLKAHQRSGVKFMWNCCFESLEQCKTHEGSGCIIAHCMGLGKTFQVIALIHTLFMHSQIGTRTVLICCPKNVVLNWVNEFKIWIKSSTGEINVFNPTRHDNHAARLKEVTRWQSEGGVCIINYELVRILLEEDTKNVSLKQFPLAQRKKFFKALCDPGADLVICDEGHMLKNEETKLAKVMSKIKTARRIILTGTPMQNNLKEYHVMVSFVKPNLLGSKIEYLNMFVNPILNGQYENSLPEDVQLMKERSHVLHKTLSGCVQRYDLTTLTQFLPEKQEYVLCCKLTDCQIQMYNYYLECYSAIGNVDSKSKGSALFADHQALQRIWTHPYSLQIHMEKKQNEPPKKSKKKKAKGDDDDESSDEEVVPRAPLSWWMRFVTVNDLNDARSSSKLVLMLEILKQCEANGEKLLVFSGSLYSISLIEHFLRKIDKSQYEDDALCGLTSNWKKEQDYFVMTGQTPGDDREKFCRMFNDIHDSRARLFLISTKAGGIGINLTAANRAIIFDVQWNPSIDIQSIFRIYRLGQSKPCFVYRVVASGTMEEKIYERQVTKQSISHRVVDEKQIARHYTEIELQELYQFDPDKEYIQPAERPRDSVLNQILADHEDIIGGYHEHDSLLEHKTEEELRENEKKGAWSAFNVINNLENLSEMERYLLESIDPDSWDSEMVKEVLKRKYKDAFPEEIDLMHEEVLPRMRQILESVELSEVMRREVLYSRKKKMASLLGPEGVLKSQQAAVGSGFEFDEEVASNVADILAQSSSSGLGGGAFSNVLAAGTKKSYFSTNTTSTKTAKTAKSTKSTKNKKSSGRGRGRVWRYRSYY